MARPSQNIDQRLLDAGRALYPDCGCAGLSVRAVAERAAVQPGMLHYHFRSKDEFLRALLQQMYDEMFAGLAHSAAQGASAFERLRAALLALAAFARANRRTIARLWMDALAGSAVVREFLHANVPRHVRLLATLAEQAEREGALRALPPLQRLATMVGGVLMPVVFVGGLADAGGISAELRRGLQREVMDDAAIAERVDLLLAALRATPPVRTAERREATA